jgi:hypothetical protein
LEPAKPIACESIQGGLRHRFSHGPLGMETSKSGLTPGTESKQRADCLGLDRAAQVVVNED